MREDKRFLCDHQEFHQCANGRKQLRIEYFYGEMRRIYNILMDGSEPEGGAWNYDRENRKPPKEGLNIPDSYHFRPDKVTRALALEALDLFIKGRLENFGDYQDAMVQNEPWLYHSHLSFLH